MINGEIPTAPDCYLSTLRYNLNMNPKIPSPSTLLHIGEQAQKG